MAIAPIKRARRADQGQEGDEVRRIDASVTGGPNGPIYKAASFVVPAYGAATSPNYPLPDCDAWYCSDCAAAVAITLPVAANTPLGTRIRATKTDSGGNALSFITTDSVAFGAGATKTTSTQGAEISAVLANVNGTYLWI